ncbi:hypothetical protein GQ55_4G308200 [Panicum hallii var. hallii]|uniref:Uncharacterized protein n=1 Tax=Panicum hallii var. hallii TaxID=1504633 RepID=A0A2T7E1U7_9POAL|nr:hypothetical protein GQ55_4G308200 [Panicum hallii var. hallii]
MAHLPRASRAELTDPPVAFRAHATCRRGEAGERIPPRLFLEIASLPSAPPAEIASEARTPTVSSRAVRSRGARTGRRRPARARWLALPVRRGLERQVYARRQAPWRTNKRYRRTYPVIGLPCTFRLARGFTARRKELGRSPEPGPPAPAGVAGAVVRVARRGGEAVAALPGRFSATERPPGF